MKTDLLKRPIEITPLLRSVELNAAGDKAFYCYDGQGERVRKVVKRSGGVVEERRYMGGYEVYRKTLAGATILQRTTHNISDGSTTFCRMERRDTAAPVLRYQYANHLGSASLELDAGGLLISYEEYRPFGTTSYRSGRTMTEVSLKRYHYCGKERDEESGLYYYGARFYADWLGRFVSVDPLTGKYPSISGYAAMNNNPIIFIDPDGRENITVVGSQNNESAGSKLMFVNQGIRALRQWSKSETESGESRSMVLFTGGYSDKQIARIEKSVAKYGGSLVKVNSAEEMTNYVNSASTGSGDLSSARTGDKVTDMEIYSHGVAGAVEFGYGTSNADSYRLDGSNVGNMSSGAFDGTNSTITSYACRTALGNDIKYAGTSFNMNTSNSLAQKMSNATGAHVAAFPVRTDYQFTLGTWSERRFGFPNAAPTIQMVGGAAFTPNGAAHPVKAGSTPLFLYQGKLNFYPRK